MKNEEVRKDIEQEKDEGGGEVLDKVERIYGRRRHLGEKGNLKNAEKLIEEFKQGGSSSKTTSGGR